MFSSRSSCARFVPFTVSHRRAQKCPAQQSKEGELLLIADWYRFDVSLPNRRKPFPTVSEEFHGVQVPLALDAVWLLRAQWLPYI